MDNQLLVFLFYKILCLISGMFSIYLGYKLFIKGFMSPAGDVTAVQNSVSISVKNAAPGTFFSLLGCFIICFTVIKGFSLDQTKSPLAQTKSFTINDSLQHSIDQKINEVGDQLKEDSLTASMAKVDAIDINKGDSTKTISLKDWNDVKNKLEALKRVNDSLRSHEKKLTGEKYAALAQNAALLGQVQALQHQVNTKIGSVH